MRLAAALFSVLTVTATTGCDFAGDDPAGGAGVGSASGGGGGSRTGGGGAGGASGAGGGGVPAGGGSGGAAAGAADAAVTQGDAAVARGDAAVARGDAGTPGDAASAPSADAARSADAAPSADVGAVPTDGGASAYPAGPYGLKVGDVVASLGFTGEDGKPLTLGDLRARPGTKVILWSSGAEWCTACRAETKKLERLHVDRAARGLIVLETLHQNVSGKPADLTTLQNWRRDYKVTYPLAVEMSPSYNRQTINPYSSVIDARTMKIVARVIHGEGDIVAAVDAALAAAR